MARSRVRIALVVGGLSLIGLAAFQQGCGSEGDSEFPDRGDAGSNEGDGGTPPGFGDAQSPPNTDGSKPCVNLQCNQVSCEDGGTTTISGKVYDPAGKNPLYNALVYIPNGKVEPFDDDAGVTCDKCGGAFASGAPLVADITGPDGTFTLKNVPVDVTLPMVIQVGKWRRVVSLPAATRCTNNPITDVSKLRLPRNQSEGHIPLTAIATGGADPFECLLLKIGIDASEFTLPGGSGRMHMYRAHSGVDLAPDAGGGDAGTPLSSVLWNDPAALRRYDVVLFPCEATPNNAAKEAALQQTDAGYGNVEHYVDIGGRLFTTHYSYTWLERAPQPFPMVANWQHDESDRSDRAGANATLFTQIDTSFPKGLAFSQWLSFVGASPDAGVLPIVDWRHDVQSENKPPSQRWITADTRTAYADASTADANAAGNVVEHFTFNAPIEAGVDDAGAPLQCGKAVFSDFHVSAGERTANQPFPQECKLNPMSPQEKALEFMLFDLSACIQIEDQPPPPPPPPPPTK